MQEKITPAMKQYYDIKNEFKDCILFFRMGDFYEMFDEDAHIAGKELGITVTSRNKNAEKPTPLAGIPYHAGERYLAELTKKGYKVAIAEQTSDSSMPGIVTRKIVRVVTPATTMQEEVLGKGTSNFLISITELQNIFTIALVDISTGNCLIKQMNGLEALESSIFQAQPKEILLATDLFSTEDVVAILKKQNLLSYYFYTLEKNPKKIIEEQFGSHALDAMQITSSTEKQHTIAMVLQYLQKTQLTSMDHLRHFRQEDDSQSMKLDESTIRNLELLFTQREGKKEGSLLGVLDMTCTGSGARLLHSWILRPLLQKELLEKRLDKVQELYTFPSLRKELRTHLHSMYDLERLLAKISMDRAHGRDLVAVKNSLSAILQMHSALGEEHKEIQELYSHIPLAIIRELQELLELSIADEPPITLQEGGIIKQGFRPDIDEVRDLKLHASSWLLSYQQQEQERTGINSLKIKFNNVFGYFIELTKNQAHNAPENYIRRQTMVGAERYTTIELKTQEDKILHAEDELSRLEYACFQEIRTQVLSHLQAIQQAALLIAELDVYTTFAEVAHDYQYVRPEFTNTKDLHITKGRHPVVDVFLRKQQEQCIPNSLSFRESKEELLLITGPNMAGKSTFLRQNALISLLAQIGSYVPAEKAELPLLDAIFTRVGASDNVSKGQSTFMVEMQETAYILTNATDRSLIILDEVGRGTSTYDGLSIAWAIVEYIHSHIKAKTLFATHYHELIDVVEKLPRGKNYSVAVQETSSGMVFLRKIVAGGASESYGIEVAKLAGLPQEVIQNASSFLKELEKEDTSSKKKNTKENNNQLSFFVTAPSEKTVIAPLINPLVEKIKNISLDHMTPIECQQYLMGLQKELQ